MKAVSAVIVVILLLMISVSLAGFAYVFITTTASTTMETGTEMIEQTTSTILAQMKIDSVSDNRVYVRNTGKVDLTGFSVYVNDKKVNISAPSSIAPGAIGSITMYSFISKDDSIKVTSGGGTTAVQKAADPCASSSVVLCLKFDDCTARDSSGYGNDGNLINSPTCVDGISGKAFEFDAGLNQQISVPDDPSIHLDGKDFTITILLKPQPQAGYRFAYQKWRPNLYISNNDASWSFELHDTAWPGGNPVPVSIYELIDGSKWYFVAQSVKQESSPGAYDGQNKGIIVVPNGTVLTAVRNDIGTTVGSDGANMLLSQRGWMASGNVYYEGIIDEVRIYNKAIY
jgi:FlaG/FlaF family flagellin (archaellin)